MVSRLIGVLNKVLTWFRPLARRRQIRKIILRQKRWSPKLFVPVSPDVEKKHLELWRRLESKPSLDWVRFFSNLSGLADSRYCPEDIYHAKIEGVLNERARRGFECEDKNVFYYYVDKKYLPKVALRYIRGVFYDADFNALDYDMANKVLSVDRGTLIGKVASGSLGGHGVEAFDFVGGRYCRRNGLPLTLDYIASAGSYILQERVEQCDFTAQFNPASCNTFRMITLRCPWNGQIVLLKSGMRVGVTNAPVDNLSSGGICVPVDGVGNLCQYGYTYMTMVPYDRYSEHPTSHVKFAGKQHPDFEKMKAAVIESAARMPHDNILAWDVVVDKAGEVKFLEVNVYSLGIDRMQYAFGSLFGDLTERVVDWCVQHSELRSEDIVRF